jgi:hypothetical protein
MTAELDIYGVFVPALSGWLLLAYVGYLIAHQGLAWSGFYLYVWHRPLFDVALYVVLLGAIVFTSAWLQPW